MLLSLFITLIIILNVSCIKMYKPVPYVLQDEYQIVTTILYPGGRLIIPCPRGDQEYRHWRLLLNNEKLDGQHSLKDMIFYNESMLEGRVVFHINLGYMRLNKHRKGNHFELICLNYFEMWLRFTFNRKRVTALNKFNGYKLVIPGTLIDRVKNGNEECENNKGKLCDSKSQEFIKSQPRLCLRGKTSPDTTKTECDIYKEVVAEKRGSMAEQGIAYFLGDPIVPTKCDTSHDFWADGKKIIPASIIRKLADEKIEVYWYHNTDKFEVNKAKNLECWFTLAAEPTNHKILGPAKKVNIYLNAIEPDGVLAKVTCFTEKSFYKTYFFVGRDINITCPKTIWKKHSNGIWNSKPTLTTQPICGVPRWMKQVTASKPVKQFRNGKYTIYCEATVKYCYTNKQEIIVTKKECSPSSPSPAVSPTATTARPRPTSSHPMTTSTKILTTLLEKSDNRVTFLIVIASLLGGFIIIILFCTLFGVLLRIFSKSHKKFKKSQTGRIGHSKNKETESEVGTGSTSAEQEIGSIDTDTNKSEDAAGSTSAKQEVGSTDTDTDKNTTDSETSDEDEKDSSKNTWG